MSRKAIEAMFGAMMFFLGAALMIHTYADRYRDTGVGVEFGPIFYPRVLLWAWLALSAGVVLQTLFSSTDASGKKYDWKKAAIMMIMIAVCTYLLDIIGFLFSTILFFIVSCRYFGYRKVWQLALIGVGAPTATWYVFQYILQIQLPTSIFFYWV